MRATILSLLFLTSHAVEFAAYYDSDCSLPITNSLVFTDVCTWSSNQYSGSWSLYLNDCSPSQVTATLFNATDSPTCVGTPAYTFSMNESCSKFEDAYVKVLDFTCDSQNTVFNVLTHFEADCKDGGIPFSVQLGNPSCLKGQFAPGFFDWDVKGSYESPFYRMNVFNTTNGTCHDDQATFQTTSFPHLCLSPQKPFQNIHIDIYNSFPVAIEIL